VAEATEEPKLPASVAAEAAAKAAAAQESGSWVACGGKYWEVREVFAERGSLAWCAKVVSWLTNSKSVDDMTNENDGWILVQVIRQRQAIVKSHSKRPPFSATLFKESRKRA
jgi:hypothetical protein